MSAEIVRSLPEAEWGRFVAEHPTGNVFHTPEMFQVFSRARGHRPELWAAVDGSRILALFPPVRLTLMPTWPLSVLTTRLVAYGSVLCAPGQEGLEALGSLLGAYVRRGGTPPVFTELRNLTALQSEQPVLQRQGFRYEEHLNYIIDIGRPPEEILASISKSARRQVRRFGTKGAVVEEVDGPERLARFHGLLQSTFQRADMPLADISLFQAVLDVLVPKGMAKVFLAKAEGRYIAASLEVPYKDTIYSWYSGYDREFRDYSANDGLVWHALEWGANHGYRHYDFGGAGIPGQPYGPRDFKAKYNGRLVSYGRNVYVHSPLMLGASRVGFAAWRRLMHEWHRLRGAQAAGAGAGLPEA